MSEQIRNQDWRNSRRKEVSVVIPVYNEEGSIQDLLHDVIKGDFGCEISEIIVVDDGSSDSTVEMVQSLIDARISLVRLHRNMGQAYAIIVGLRHATAEWVVTLDGDGQNPAINIGELVSSCDDECAVVLGRRRSRIDDEGRKVASRVGNAYLRRVTGVKISDFGCSAKLFRRDLLCHVPETEDLHRYLGAFLGVSSPSFREVDVSHKPRVHGESKYGYGRAYKVLFDGIVLFFRLRILPRPILFFGAISVLSSATGIAVGVWSALLKFGGGLPFSDNPLITISLVLFSISLNSLFIGLLVEIISKQNRTVVRGS